LTEPKTQSALPAEHNLANFAAELRVESIPENVLKEAKRSLVNIFATALGGCREEAIDIAIGTLALFAGPRMSTLIG
jgi:2-methylcitrate dehydratase PrpD